MIPLKKQVACRELSKKLKEFEFPQESQWWWHYNKKTRKWYIDRHLGGRFPNPRSSISAPTGTELGTILPAYFRTYKFKRNDGKGYGFACDNDIDESQWDNDELRRLMKSELYKEYRYEEADTEADAKAQMVVSLLKDNLIKIGKSKKKE